MFYFQSRTSRFKLKINARLKANPLIFQTQTFFLISVHFAISQFWAILKGFFPPLFSITLYLAVADHRIILMEGSVIINRGSSPRSLSLIIELLFTFMWYLFLFHFASFRSLLLPVLLSKSNLCLTIDFLLAIKCAALLQDFSCFFKSSTDEKLFILDSIESPFSPS